MTQIVLCVMKTLAMGSFFVLFAIVAGLTVPNAFASDSTIEVTMAEGSGVPGCEETAEGCYLPTEVSAHVGDTVSWSNTDTAAHTVTSGTAADGPDGTFDSGLMVAGAIFEWTAEGEGTVPYFCMVHPWMVGTVMVEAEGAEDDDHMMGDGNGMMMGESSVEGMLSDGTEVELWATAPAAGKTMEISVEFHDSEHVNYDIMVTQKGTTVLDTTGVHEHQGMGSHTTNALSSADPVDVTITFQGFGIDTKTGPIGEQVVFTNVVPEFGTIATLILVVAIGSIIAVTARSKISLTPRL